MDLWLTFFGSLKVPLFVLLWAVRLAACLLSSPSTLRSLLYCAVANVDTSPAASHNLWVAGGGCVLACSFPLAVLLIMCGLCCGCGCLLLTGTVCGAGGGNKL